ncbi:MAG: LacI family DNA-binding transcriptional regulator [Microbacterium sp.]|uniref:LacI family DNA-binding transcriptional regulator n=1 Tax=Microbacterium sp. TaxID=51671 RepID=UPI003BAE7A09
MNNVGHQQAGLVDVAQQAGVSLSTVSRVLTGRTPVSAKLREKVLAAVAALDYRPNAAAQALVNGRTTTVAVFARNTIRYGYAATLQGIEEAARAAGYTVTITVVESGDPAHIQAAVNQALSQQLAGAVVIEFDEVGIATLEALPESLPVVAAAGARRPRGARPHAFLDDYRGGRIATEYLLSLGHRTVHHIAIPATRIRTGRAWGWRQALQDAGAPVPKLVQAGYSPASGHEAAQAVLDDPDVTAVLCGNDELAIGVLRALQERGVAVPRQISVVGFDDQPFAQQWFPSLTTVSQDFIGLGQRTFQLLESWLRTGERPKDTAMSPQLIVRESTSEQVR